ncbi:hypothetical protein E2C01_101912 [Portunus trituberculatus]|uniref:Uncharacterized protein n=1 Tax=Portunus trituberculatus TaxID=210409 RepID=A0A5B7K6S9_PORTR|nr:hypothetical protein [Portunus trituberculatus]
MEGGGEDGEGNGRRGGRGVAGQLGRGTDTLRLKPRPSPPNICTTPWISDMSPPLFTSPANEEAVCVYQRAWRRLGGQWEGGGVCVCCA